MDISRFGRKAFFALSALVTLTGAFPDAAMASGNLRWGFVNKEGEMIIQPQFLEAGMFSEGLAPVKTDAGWGYLDRSGKVVLEGFDQAEVFSEGLAAVKIPSSGPLVEKLGKDSAELWGFIDSSGKFVIKPQFQDAGPFREGLAAVASGGKYGFIDRDGTFEIKPQFDLACNFSGDRAAVLINEQTGSLSLKVGEDIYRVKGGRWYYINKKGEAEAGMFEDCGAYVDKLAPVAAGKYQGTARPDRWGFINDKGRYVIKPSYNDAHAMSEGKAAVQVGTWKSMGKGIRSWEPGKWGYVNKSGKTIIKAEFDGADPFSEGMAAIKMNGKWGYINEDGDIIIKPRFAGNLAFKEGLAAVVVDKSQVQDQTKVQVDDQDQDQDQNDDQVDDE